jgi:hypothetical protein
MTGDKQVSEAGSLRTHLRAITYWLSSVVARLIKSDRETEVGSDLTDKGTDF